MTEQNSLPTAVVIGGGPAGLMAAEQRAEGGVAVTVYDGMRSVGRKFLLAGRGGLNITHSESFEQFVGRYGRAQPAFNRFLPNLAPTTCAPGCMIWTSTPLSARPGVFFLRR